jgi:hypothetical protein
MNKQHRVHFSPRQSKEQERLLEIKKKMDSSSSFILNGVKNAETTGAMANYNYSNH